MVLMPMLREKKATYIESCEIANKSPSKKNAISGNDKRAEAELEEEHIDYVEKLRAMSELQRAIIAQLIPLAPRAIHSAVLREAVAPFFTAWDRKAQRREFEAAVDPLVRDGLVRYFCCIIDSYAVNPRHLTIARYLDGQTHDD